MDCPKCGAKIDAHATECPICFASLEEPTVGVPGGLSAVHNMAIPKEEEYMPIVGIPGLDHTPQQPAAPPPNYLSGNQPGPPPPNYLSGNQPAAPLPNYLSGAQQAPPGGGTGEVRVSLTGEVIQSQTPASGIPGIYPQQQAPGGYPPAAPGGPIPPRAGIPGRMPAPARPGARSTRSAPTRGSRSESKGGGGGAIAIIVVLVLLAGGGAGGWWFWQQKQRAPAIAVEKLMVAFKNKDWKTFYAGLELPEQQKAVMTPERFDQAMSMVGNMVTLKDYKVGEVTNNGDTATVSVTQTVSLSGPLAALAQGGGDQTKTQQIPMRLVNGAWKIDGTSIGAAMGGLPGMGGGMSGAGRQPRGGGGAGRPGRRGR